MKSRPCTLLLLVLALNASSVCVCDGGQIENGGGIVRLGPGRYISGPSWMKDNVELHLQAGATVVLSPERKDRPAGVRALVNVMERTIQP